MTLTASRLLTCIATLFSLTVVASGAFVPSSTSTFVTTSSLIPLASSQSSSTEMASEVKAGDKLPAVNLMELKTDGEKPEPVNLAELIAGKKVAIFGVPGAFTPGCSKSHLPSFIDAQADLKAKGVEMTICVATNDPFVMEVRVYMHPCVRDDLYMPASQH